LDRSFSSLAAFVLIACVGPNAAAEIGTSMQRCTLVVQGRAVDVRLHDGLFSLRPWEESRSRFGKAISVAGPREGVVTDGVCLERECHIIVETPSVAELWRLAFDPEMMIASAVRVWSAPTDECRELAYTSDGALIVAGVDSAALILDGRACRVVYDASLYSTGAAITTNRLLMTNGRSLREWQISSARCAPFTLVRTVMFSKTVSDIAASPAAAAALLINQDSTASVLTLDDTLRPVGELRLPGHAAWFIRPLRIGVAVFSHQARQMWLVTSQMHATEYQFPDLGGPSVPIATNGELRLSYGETVVRPLRVTAMSLRPYRSSTKRPSTVAVLFTVAVIAGAVVVYLVIKSRVTR
jgi:hypothetical protein